MNINKLFSVKDKVVLITGGSRGIGLMIGEACSSRSADVCDKVAKELNDKGPGKCFSIPADISKLSEVKRLVGEISKKERGINVLINNAGANWGESLDKYPDEAFEKVLNLNVKRVFSLTQACLPLLEKVATNSDPARVINIGSVDGIRTPALETYAYSTSKAALHHLSSHLASHLGSRNITCNAIAPGPFQSKMMKATLEKFEESIVSGIPLNRIGSPEDMAGVCLYLSSKAGAYVSGALIAVDGGSLVKARI
ncbi:hypothetical protein HK099_006802 [Clydaea vesicula]|uniref:3-oxoacyl-ACP reductase n=1 Tax=Clydaea vesicula TaxID=447962 RepID=A0AAD5U5V9_9FUNG|nr:hypothetical protein HK099_006802 [Clydaea vesicula]